MSMLLINGSSLHSGADVLDIEKTLHDARMDAVGGHAFFGFGLGLVGIARVRGNIEVEIELAVALGLPAGIEPVHVAAAHAEQRDRADDLDAPWVDDALDLNDFVRRRPIRMSKFAWLVEANLASSLTQLLKMLPP